MSTRDELFEWFTSVGLEKYYEVFLENDIDSIDLAMSLSLDDLKELGVSLGDRKRFERLLKPVRAYSELEQAVVEKYPYVIAYPFRRMLDEEDGRNRLELLSYVLLNLLKFTGLVIASDYFRSTNRSARLNDLFRSNLFQPSMGHWNAFIREAIVILKSEGMEWSFPALISAYEALETSSKSKKYATETEYTDEGGLLKWREAKLTAIGTLINFRNRYLGHGMPLEKAQYADLFEAQYPVLTDLLQGFSCLTEYVMLRNDQHGCCLLQGDSVRLTETDLVIPRDADMHLRDAGGRQLPLLPFYIVPGKYNAGDDGRARVLVYEQNTTQRLIFYSPESVKAEVSGDVLERLRLTLEEKERETPIPPEGFTEERLLERIQAHNARILDGLHKEMKVIDGVYQHRFEAELSLMGWAGAAAGLYFLAAEAGSGKTNLLAHLVHRYTELGYPTLLLRGNRLSKPTLEEELRHVLNLQSETLLSIYPGLLSTQDRPLMLLVDGGNEGQDPGRLLQSAIELVEACPGGGLKVVMSWRVNDISQVPTAVVRNPDVLFPASSRPHVNPLAAKAYLLQPMSLVETEGAWKGYAAHSSRRFRPRFDFQDLLLADRPLALELGNPLLLRLCMELFHDKGLKGKSKGFANLWRQWWEGLRRQPQEAEYLQQLARFLATKGRVHCTLDELFDDTALSAAVNNLQVDSPHRQLIRKGVVSQYFQDGILQVGFTMEAALHYVLSLELTPEDLAGRVAGNTFWEAPARYRLWEGVQDPNDGLLFQLIDDASFPNHLTAFALAQYTVLHGPGKALELLLQEPTPQDWEALSLAARQLRESRPKEHRALADAILEQVLAGGHAVSSDLLAPLLPDCIKSLADAVFAERLQGHPPLTAEGLQSLGTYHSTYGRNREALACLQEALELSADIKVTLSVYLGMAEQYDQLGQYDAGLEEVAKAKELLVRGVVSDSVLEADIGFRESKLNRSKALYPKALEILRYVREAYAKKLGVFHAKTLLSDFEYCRMLLSLGQSSEASVLAEKSANDAARYLGTHNTIHSDFVQFVGDLCEERGQYDAALGKYEEALAIEMSCLGDRHPYIAGSYSRIGGIWKTKGDYDKALGYFERSLAINLEYYGESHPEVAVSYNRIGGIWNTKGDYDKALGYFERSLAINLEYYGESHPEVAVSYNRIGGICQTKGEYDKALGYYENALEIILEYYGESHPKVAGSYNRIGGIWETKGEYDKALGYFERDLEISMAFYGGGHPNVAITYNRIGIIWIFQGEYDRALEYFEKHLSINLDYFGSSHPEVGVSYISVGDVNNFKGEYEKAFGYFEKALEVFQAFFGQSHPKVAISLSRIGDVLESKGDFEKALGFFEKALEINSTYFGESHPDVAFLVSRIGGIWETMGEYDRALGYFERDLSIGLVYYGESHPNVAVSYNRIGGIWDAKGDYEKALGYYEKDLAINLHYFGESHPTVAISYKCIGGIWETMGDYDKALEYFERSHKMNLEFHGDSHPEIAVSYNRIGGIWEIKGEYDKALGFYERNLAINLKYYGEAHPNVAASYNRIGGIWETRGEYDKALSFFEKDLLISLECYGESHPSVAVSYNRIGGIWEFKGEYDKALGYFQKDLEVSVACFGDSHPDVALSFFRIGDVYFAKGKYDKGLLFYERNLAVNLECYGESHPTVATAYNRIGGVFEARGLYDEALESFQRSLAINLEYFGESHPNVSSSYNRIGGILEAKGQYGEALVYFEKDLEISSSIFGEIHASVAVSHNSIGLLKMRMGNFSEALTAFKAALDISLHFHPESHPNIGAVKKNIAHVMIELGDLGEAESLLQDSIESLSRSGNVNDTRLGKSYQYLANLYRHLGDSAAAESAVAKAIDVMINDKGESHPDTAEAYFENAMILKSAGKYAEADLFFRKCHAIRLEKLGELHPDTVEVASHLQS